MKKLFDNYVTQLKSYYCREDIEDLLNEFDEADEDRRMFVLARLKKQCKIRGISVKDLLSDRTLLKQIPDRKEMQDALLAFFYSLYKNSLPPRDYMERIVRRLAPEYAGDTVRTAILKKFVKGADVTGKVGVYNVKPLLDKAETLLSADERKNLSSLQEKDKKDLLISKIDDSFFDQKDVTLTDKDLFLVIVQCTDKYRQDTSLHFTGISVASETEAQLKEFCRIYGLDSEGSVFGQLLILCDALDNDGALEKDERFAALTKSLDKDFRSQLSRIQYVNSKGKTCRLSEKYEQARKDRMKALKKQAQRYMPDPLLLKLCNDLAEGNFRGNGMTRVQLYYFAIMFGMDLSVNESTVNEDRDIEKNLFQDYYNDNLLRFLSVDYRDRTDLEQEPTGEGINYKSYVETSYLYFLCRKDLSLTPGERINRAEKTIEAVYKARNRSRASEGGNKAPKAAEEQFTAFYKDTLFSRLLKKEPDQIVDFILDNGYRIVSPENPNSSRIMSDSDERTAYIQRNIILEEEEKLPENKYLLRNLLSGNRKKKDNSPQEEIEILFQTDKEPSQMDKEVLTQMDKEALFLMDRSFDWTIKKLLEDRFASDEDFLKLVEKLDDRAHVDRGRFKKSMRIQILVLLRELAMASNGERKTRDKIKEDVSREVPFVDRQFSNALEILKNMGFDIRKEETKKRVKEEAKEEEKKKNRDSNYVCWLGTRHYEDEMLNQLLAEASRFRYSFSENAEVILMQTMEARLKQDKRITRSEMISFFLNYYISDIENNERSIEMQEDFPGLFTDFASEINYYLEEARYQPLSVKNIYDMYIVTALYYHMLESIKDS